MEINLNTSAALTQINNGGTTNGDIGMAVLKKAIDTQTQGAVALINAIPQPPSPQNLPLNLGRHINVTA